jgi:cell fate regulator YaaT (PSP1 superfamily)
VSAERPPSDGAREPASGAAAPTLNLAGVKLTATGRTFACDAGKLTLRVGDRVVLDDEQGSVATVAVASALRAASPPVPRAVRVAEPRDLARLEADLRRAADALAFARDRVKARNLPIKVFRVEMHGAGGRAIFYFAAEQRIDFRELVRDLASHVHARVEMRQVGVRDEAKMVGGIGSCGRELCCSTFLPKFAPVSIKMAKNQNLALNPTKVSGQCGRLKCCLVYEEANYVEAAKRLPRSGKRVTTPEGVGRVGDVDVLRERVRVYFEDQPPKVFAAADVHLLAAPGEPAPTSTSAEPREAAPRDETPPEPSPDDAPSE